MAVFNEKLRKMEDEMNRFEEEIGLPNDHAVDVTNKAPRMVGKPALIGTNTYFQAERKIDSINMNLNKPADNMESQIKPLFNRSSFLIPSQVQQRVASSPAIAANMVPPPPPPPAFVMNNMFHSPSPNTTNFSKAMIPSSVRFIQRFPESYSGQVSEATSSRVDDSSNSITKPAVVLSATPKLYTAIPEIQGKKTTQLSQIVTPNLEATAKKLEAPKKKKKKKVAKGSSEPTMRTLSGEKITGPIDQAMSQQNKKKDKKKKVIRVSGGQAWEDPSLTEWEEGDFRLFCGDLGNDVTDELLSRIFSRYPSFLKARVVRDKRTNKTKGFGFISFKDPQDFIRASKEMNGRYVGSRPIKLRKSTWKNRNMDVVKKKEKEKASLIALLTGQ